MTSVSGVLLEWTFLTCIYAPALRQMNHHHHSSLDKICRCIANVHMCTPIVFQLSF